MTNKSLSEQICEVCSIELKYWCSYHDTICPIQDAGKFNPKCPKQAVTKECDARSYKPQYIDFENNNNNFVKLLEIIHNKIGLSDFFLLMRYDNNPFKKELLHLINELLNKRLGYRVILVTEIKKIIKETNWEY